MLITELHEPIKTRVDFAPGGKVTPLLFKRRNQEVFRVMRVCSSWEDKEQNHRLLYFSVAVDRGDEIFALCYRESDRTWWLQQVMYEG